MEFLLQAEKSTYLRSCLERFRSCVGKVSPPEAYQCNWKPRMNIDGHGFR